MKSLIQKSILAGIVGTAIMSMVMFVAPFMGMPKMSPPDMLAGMLGLPIIVGWMMHFMVGITFALAYALIISPKFKISNIYVKGAIFGVIAFVFAQIMMKVMGAIMPMPAMEGAMVLTLIGGLMGHIIFGIVVAKTIGGVNTNQVD